MSDQTLYSPIQAARAANISIQSLRNYTERYREYLSPHAVPQPGQTRWFTPKDVAVLAYIWQRTVKDNLAHKALLAELAEDRSVIDNLEPIEAPEEAAPESPQPAPAELMPPQMARVYEALLNDARTREQEARKEARETDQQARDREAQLQEEIARLRQELGEAKGALDAYRQMNKRPDWYRLLFGGE